MKLAALCGYFVLENAKWCIASICSINCQTRELQLFGDLFFYCSSLLWEMSFPWCGSCQDPKEIEGRKMMSRRYLPTEKKGEKLFLKDPVLGAPWKSKTPEKITSRMLSLIVAHQLQYYNTQVFLSLHWVALMIILLPISIGRINNNIYLVSFFSGPSTTLQNETDFITLGRQKAPLPLLKKQTLQISDTWALCLSKWGSLWALIPSFLFCSTFPSALQCHSRLISGNKSNIILFIIIKGN